MVSEGERNKDNTKSENGARIFVYIYPNFKSYDLYKLIFEKCSINENISSL